MSDTPDDDVRLEDEDHDPDGERSDEEIEGATKEADRIRILPFDGDVG